MERLVEGFARWRRQGMAPAPLHMFFMTPSTATFGIFSEGIASSFTRRNVNDHRFSSLFT